MPDDDSRSFSDVSREDEPDKLPNGTLLPDFTSYHLDPNASSQYNNFVNYIPPKPEWKRYKQYTKNDLLYAIEAVKNGMTALQVIIKKLQL